MKRIILLELCLLFLATTFQGDNPPPGWYIQSIPVNKNIVDIHFTDTLHGWAVTALATSNDTGYVLKTTNGGVNWSINYSTNASLTAMQFIDDNTGYFCGGNGHGLLCKTTNGGTDWNVVINIGLYFTNLYFLNKDTGWVCDNDLLFGVGLLKTTNGGINWTQQLNNSYQPKKLFFLNKDTGWVMTEDLILYRTLNSGANWSLKSNLSSGSVLYNLYFTSINTGWIIRYNNNSDRILKTTDGGDNWIVQIDPNPVANGSAPFDIHMINSTYGYINTGYSKILKTIDGINWKRQDAPAGYYNGGGLYFTDSLHGWSNHGYPYNIVSTIDGGGPLIGIKQISSEVPDGFKLEQNFPNPLNSTSKIKYQISKSSNIKIILFDITGKEVSTLINQHQSSGTYEYSFDGNGLSSGIYFYSLFADGVLIETKRMMLLK